MGFKRRNERDVSREDLPTPEITSPIRRRISVPVIGRKLIMDDNGVVIGHRDVNSGEDFYPNSGDLHNGNFPEALVHPVRREVKIKWKRDDDRSMTDKLPYIRWPLGWMVKAVPPIEWDSVMYRITSEKLWEHDDKFVAVSSDIKDGTWHVVFYEYISGRDIGASCDLADIGKLLGMIEVGVKSLIKGVLFSK